MTPTRKRQPITQQEVMEKFEEWWHNEGSGMPPQQGEDHAIHVERMCRIAWSNGAYVNGIVE